MAEPCSKCTQEAETGQHAEPSCPECHPPVKFDPDYHLPMAVITVEEVEEMTQRIADLERWQREAVPLVEETDCECEYEKVGHPSSGVLVQCTRCRLLAEAGS